MLNVKVPPRWTISVARFTSWRGGNENEFPPVVSNGSKRAGVNLNRAMCPLSRYSVDFVMTMVSLVGDGPDPSLRRSGDCHAPHARKLRDCSLSGPFAVPEMT